MIENEVTNDVPRLAAALHAAMERHHAAAAMEPFEIGRRTTIDGRFDLTSVLDELFKSDEVWRSLLSAP